MNFLTAQIEITVDDSKLSSYLARAERAFTRTANKLTSIGRKMTMRVTLPLLALATTIAKIGISMESAFIGVRKTVEATEQQFAILQKGFEEMSLRVPLSIESLYGLGEAAGQLGIQTDKILRFSETMAQLGITTDISAREAAMSLARFANITQMSQDQFDRLGATIVDLGNTFAAMESEIVGMGLRIASAGKIAGMSEANIMAIAAALSAVGIQAQIGGTSVQKVIIQMTRAVAEGNKELKVFADVAGKTVEDFATLFRRDAIEAFTIFIEGLKRSGDTAFTILENLGLADQRLIRALLSLAGANDLLRNTIQRGNKAWEENIALTREAELRFGSTASQLRLFWNDVKLTADSFKKILMPPVLDFIDNYMKPLLDVFKNFNDEAKRSIVIYAALAAAIGPVLLITGSLVKSMAALIFVIQMIGPTFMAIAAAIAAPLTAVIALAAIAYVLRAAWVQNLKVVKDRMQDWLNSFKEGFDWLITGPLGETVKIFAKSWIETFNYVRTNFGDFISDLAATAGGTMSWLKKMKEGIVSTWTAWDLRQAIAEFKSGWKEAGESFALTFVDSKEKADKALAEFTESVISGYKTTAITLAAFGEATVEHLEDLLEAVKTQFGEDADIIINLIKSKIQSLQKIPISPHEQLRQMLMELEKDLKNIAQGMEEVEFVTEETVKTTMTLADAYRTMRDEMGRMTKEVYESQLKIIDGLRKDYEAAGVNVKVLTIWYKEQAELLSIEYLKAAGGIAGGFQAAGMQIKREITTWGERAYEFSMTFRDSIASGLEATMRDFDNWRDHLLNVFEEVYWSAMRIAFIEPIAGKLAGVMAGAVGGLLTPTAPLGSAANPFIAPKGSFGAPKPELQHGGTVLETGWAKVHKGETYSGVQGNYGRGNLEVHIRNEGSEKLEVSNAQEYVLSDRRIINVTTRAMIMDKRYQNSIKQASR